LTTDLSFRRFRELSDQADLRAFRTEMEKKGYPAFFSFAEEFREAIKQYADGEARDMLGWIRRAREWFPNPGRFSPAWERLWEEFERICASKNEALAAIPPGERDGEWQVLIDNPYVPQQVVCYPGLTFAEAVYLFAYFRLDLAPNEYVRLQRVTNVMTVAGTTRPSSGDAARNAMSTP
jgi:hypothetical protein